jgi:hypothetical protein
MPKSFAEYGLTSEEFDGLVLEDPALFDGFLVRVVEDLDLCQQVVVGRLQLPEIDASAEAAIFALEFINAVGAKSDAGSRLVSAYFGEAPRGPDGLRSNIEPIVRGYIRGPLAYTDWSLDNLTNVVTVVAFDVLSTGGRHAREDQTDIVKLRHWLPACEHWPYPLNRFC